MQPNLAFSFSYHCFRLFSVDNAAKVKLVEPCLQKIAKEINDICMGVQETIEKDILPFASSAESKATFHKMIGDYARYLCEIEPRDTQTFKNLSEKALKAYQTGKRLSLSLSLLAETSGTHTHTKSTNVPFLLFCE